MDEYSKLARLVNAADIKKCEVCNSYSRIAAGCVCESCDAKVRQALREYVMKHRRSTVQDVSIGTGLSQNTVKAYEKLGVVTLMGDYNVKNQLKVLEAKSSEKSQELARVYSLQGTMHYFTPAKLQELREKRGASSMSRFAR